MTDYIDPGPVNAEVHTRMVEIGNLLLTQDGQCTAEPMYVVQVRRRLFGFDTVWTDDIAWLGYDHEEEDPEEHARLERIYQETLEEPAGYTRTGYMDTWEFVQVFLTDKAAREFVVANKHRHSGDLRVFVDSGIRNPEWKAVRNHLIGLAK